MASMIATHPEQTQHEPFETVAVKVLRDLRAAVGMVIGRLPHAGEIRKPADLQRQLQIDSKLAWQVHRLAFTNHPPTLTTATAPAPPIAAGIPKIPALKRFLKAAQQRGVSKEIIAAANDVLQRLDNLIAKHAGDFATFESMLAGLSKGASEQVDLAHRRAAFRAQSHLWGVQVKTILASALYHPGKNSSVFDVASFRGLREIRRLRAGAPFRLSSQQLTDGRLHSTEPEPLQTRSQKSEVRGQSSEGRTSDLGPLTSGSVGPNLLLEYCTQPYPELDNRIEGGCVHTFLRDTPLGNAGVQTLYLADVTRDIEWESPPGGEPNHHIKFAAVMKPAEALVLDALIHRDMFGPLFPTVKVFGSLDRLGEPDPLKFRPEEVLPIHVEVHNLGTGLSVLPTAHVPRYAEMVESVCRQVGGGWDPEGFEVFRCIVEYPMISSVVSVRFDLPEKANW